MKKVLFFLLFFASVNLQARYLQLSQSDSFETGWYANSVGVGDFNGDGLTDVVATGADSSGQLHYLRCFLQNSLGHLDTVSIKTIHNSIGFIPRCLKIFDESGDGFDDIITTHGDPIVIYYSQGNGTFYRGKSMYSGLFVESIDIGDLDGDGNIDIVASHWNEVFFAVFWGDPSSPSRYLKKTYTHLLSPIGYSYLQIACVGIDTIPSVIIGNKQGCCPKHDLFSFDKSRNVSNQFSLSNVHTGYAPQWCTAVGDIDNNGYRELVTKASSKKVGFMTYYYPTLYYYDTVNVMAYPTRSDSVIHGVGAIRSGQMDFISGDEYVIAHSQSGILSVISKDTTLFFNVLATDLEYPDALVLADINSDGRKDIILSGGYHGYMTILYNQTPLIDLIGYDSSVIYIADTVEVSRDTVNNCPEMHIISTHQEYSYAQYTPTGCGCCGASTSKILHFISASPSWDQYEDTIVLVPIYDTTRAMTQVIYTEYQIDSSVVIQDSIRVFDSITQVMTEWLIQVVDTVCADTQKHYEYDTAIYYFTRYDTMNIPSVGFEYFVRTFKVYPNPATDILYISSYEFTQYEMYDVLGSLIMYGVLSRDETSQIDVGHLKNQVYFLFLKGGNDNTLVQFVKIE